MAAGTLFGAALSGGAGGMSASSSASTGDVMQGDTSFGSGPVVNVGGGGFSLSPQMLMIGGGLLIAGWMLTRR